MRSANRADNCSVSDWVEDFINIECPRSARRQRLCTVLPGNTVLQLRRLSVLIVYWWQDYIEDRPATSASTTLPP